MNQQSYSALGSVDKAKSFQPNSGNISGYELIYLRKRAIKSLTLMEEGEGDSFWGDQCHPSDQFPVL